MELRYKETDRARATYERYVRCLPTVKAWVAYAKFEMGSGEVQRARRCYERAVEELGEDAAQVPGCRGRLQWLLALNRYAPTCTHLDAPTPPTCGPPFRHAHTRLRLST